MDEQAHVEHISPRASKVLWLVFTPVLGAAAYSFFYLTGAVHSETFLHHYGVSTGLFPKSPTDQMFTAYGALLQTGLNWINVVKNPTIIFSAFALSVLLVAEIALLSWLPNTKFVKKASSALEAKRLIKIPVSILLISGSILIALFSLPFVANILLLAPALAGLNSAELTYKRTDRLYEQGCASAKKLSESCVAVYDNDDIIAQGFLITSSQTHAALYLDGKTTILPIKDYRIETVRSQAPAAEP
ncbi:MAG: hypothetical protein ACKVLM_00990 [Pseudomonadales bacterium]